jgi:rhodanese-related sulfurtransferase
MRAAANAAAPRLPPAEARDLIDEGNVLIVDVRDAPALKATGNQGPRSHLAQDA